MYRGDDVEVLIILILVVLVIVIGTSQIIVIKGLSKFNNYSIKLGTMMKIEEVIKRLERKIDLIEERMDKLENK